jgi:prepilin signal peptidase PulO-like enzyme (type II secretory pathway)
MGLLAGFKLSILGLFLGYIIGSVVGVGLMMFRQKKMNARIPFGPALGVGLCVALLWGAPILEWYTSLIH